MKIEDLSPMQRDIYLYIKKYIDENGFSPSVRNIGKAVGLTAPSNVQGHLTRLERKGLIEREQGKARSIRITDTANTIKDQTLAIPLIVDVSDSNQMFKDDNVLTYLPMPKSLIHNENCFAMQIKSTSMINAGINAGDTLFASKQDYASEGDIIIAEVDKKPIIAIYHLEDNLIRLQRCNDNLEPITLPIGRVKIISKVFALIRRIR